MNKKIPVLVGAATLALLLAWRLALPSQAEENSRLQGNIDVREVNLAFRTGGRVLEVKVDEGSQVKAGDLLARLDPTPLQNTVRAAESALAALTARNALLHKGYRSEDLAQAKARLDAARANLAEALSQAQRQAALAGEGAAPQKAQEAAANARAQAQAQVAIAEQQVKLLQQGFRAEEVAESDALLAQARANLDVARLALQDANLYAPSAGIVLTRAIEAGSMLQAGAPAFNLSLTQPVWARAYADNRQLAQFTAGRKVMLRGDTPGAREYHGVIGFVSPTAEFTPKSVETADLRSQLVYRLRIVVQDADAALRQGMPVSIRLARE